MENEENTLGTQEEQQESEAEAVEATADEEATEESQGETEEAPEARLAKAEAEASKWRRLFEKTQKSQIKPKTPQSVSPPLSVEETVLLANGMPEELLNELKAVAAVRKTTLLKTQTDPLFLGIKEKFEKDQKQEAASLGASRGSGAVKAKKDFTTPDLPREDHKKMVAEFR
jgi:hypothetical protein